MARAYEHLSIYRKLLINIAVVAVPLLGLTFYVNVRSAGIIYEQTGTAFLDTVQQSGIRVSDLRESAEALSLFISLDRRLNESLAARSSQVERLEAYNAIITTLADLQQTNGELSSITIFDAHTREIYSSYNSLIAPLEDHFRYTFILRAFDDSGRGSWVWSNLNDVPLVEELYQRDVISFTRPMNVSRLGAYPTGNVVAINYTSDRIGSILDDVLAGPFSAAALDFGSSEMLVRGDLHGASRSRMEEISLTAPSTAGFQSVRDESGRLVLFQVPLEGGWRLYATVPLANVMEGSVGVWLFTAAIAVLAVLSSIWTTHALQAHINVPISTLIDRMRSVQEGDLTTELVSHRQDEFGVVFRIFNAMTQRLEEMGRRLYAEGERTREAELMLLQAQINPHFLSNALDTIYWMAEQRDAREISELARWLGQFYRLNLNEGRNLVTVRQAVDQLRSYLNIQRVRFGDRIDARISVDDACWEHRIPNLLIQPLVENAVQHGIEPCRRECVIRIRIRERGGRLVIRVHDTGMGMDRSRLDQVRGDLASEQDTMRASYGLKNVHERVRIRYGEHFGIELWSRPDRGTLVKLELPLPQGENDVHHDRR